MTLVDYISHRHTPFGEILWYVVLEDDKGDYFYNIISTTEYEPVHTYKLENYEGVRPIELDDIDEHISIYKKTGSKMERPTYNKIMGIKNYLRNKKIDSILDGRN